MKIIDRYILRKFFKTFFFVAILMNLVICIVDYTEKSDDFIKHNLPLSQILDEYYVNFFLFMVSTISPISVFIAVVLITAKMASHSEINSIITSGMSFRRLLLPYLLGATVLAGIIFAMVGWVIPDAAKTKVAFQVKYLKSPYYFDERDIHIKTDDSTYLYLESYNNIAKVGYKCTIERLRGQELVYKLTSDKLLWDSVNHVWNIPQYTVHTFNGMEEKIWKGTNLDTTMSIGPRFFESRYNLNETMTFPELDEFIAQEKARGVGNTEVYENEKHERYAYPFAIIILTAMGVIVSARKSRRGSGVQIAMGFFLAFVYILFVIMSRSVAAAGSLEPMLAAWLPNLTFFGISILMYFTVPR